MNLIYLSGPPAAGKSTLMAELTAGHPRTPQPEARVPHIQVGDPAIALELGADRPLHPGTDTLAMNIQPRAITWISTRPHHLILGEGDRLATVGFLTAAAEAGYTVDLLHLDAPPALTAERAARRGTNQNPTWVKGRHTKNARLAAWAERVPGVIVHYLDAYRPTAALAATARNRIPALQSLNIM